MEKKPIFVQIFILVFCLITFLSCRDKKVEPVATTSIIPTEENPAPQVAVVTAEPIPEPEKKSVEVPNAEWLSQLIHKSNNVEYRPRENTLWQKASTETKFNRFDALQTKDNSSAKVKYFSGSQLDLNENTFIIFDQDPGLKKKSKDDRVILKDGRLTGTTKSELWIITPAAVVKLKAPAKQEQGKVQIQMAEKKLQVQVDKGAAEVNVSKGEQKFEKIIVAQANDVVVTQYQPLQIDTEKNTVVERTIAQAVEQSEKTTAAAKVEVQFEYPKDDEIQVNTDTIEIKGKLTSEGGKVLINGELVPVENNLSFSKTLSLNEGANVIVVQLVRSDATTQFYRKLVKFKRSQ